MVNKYIWIMYVLSFLVICALLYVEWLLGLVFAVLFFAAFYIVRAADQKIAKAQYDYISTLSYRVERAGKEIFNNAPLGIIIYNEDYEIEWVNPYMAELDGEDAIAGKSLEIYSDDLIPALKTKKDEIWIVINHIHYKTRIDHE